MNGVKLCLVEGSVYLSESIIEFSGPLRVSIRLYSVTQLSLESAACLFVC